VGTRSDEVPAGFGGTVEFWGEHGGRYLVTLIRHRLFDSSEQAFGGGLFRTQCLHGIY